MSVNSKMTALADEIRELSGTTTTKSIDTMTSDVNAANTEISEQMDLIAQISTALDNKASGSGGTILPSLENPASASDILSGKEAIDGDGNVLTGTIATKTSSNLTTNGATVSVPAGYYASNASKSVITATQATPSVSIDANGKITATATQTAGYVTAGTKSGTKQLTTKSATTYTPSTSNQTISSGTYLTGTQTINGDANLKAENIKSGVSIFGVSGTYQGSTTEGSGSSNAGEWIAVNSLPTTYIDLPGALGVTVYYEIPENCKSVVFREPDSNRTVVSYLSQTGEFTSTNISTSDFDVSDADGTGTVLKIIYTTAFNDVLLLPIFATT